MTGNNRSIKLTGILIKTAMVLCFISLFIMPYGAKIYRQVSLMSDDVTIPLLITFYSCAGVGFVILFVLDRLVENIRKGDVFVNGNIKLLRILSYCCFIISVITLIFARFRIIVFVITFGAAFFGLIIRVLKNVFEKAVQIQEENEGTI